RTSARRRVHLHLGTPPSGPLNDAEWAVRTHVDDAASVAPSLNEAYEPIMRKEGRPALDFGGEAEDALQGCDNEPFIERPHLLRGRHRTELEWRKVAHGWGP